jgi:hypothetical protein
MLTARAARTAAAPLTNGNFYIAAGRSRRAQPIVIVDGCITFVSGDTGAVHRTPAGAGRPDPRGAIVVPLGFAARTRTGIDLCQLTFIGGNGLPVRPKKRLREAVSRGAGTEMAAGWDRLESKLNSGGRFQRNLSQPPGRGGAAAGWWPIGCAAAAVAGPIAPSMYLKSTIRGIKLYRWGLRPPAKASGFNTVQGAVSRPVSHQTSGAHRADSTGAACGQLNSFGLPWTARCPQNAELFHNQDRR